jgi:hypothetical protein
MFNAKKMIELLCHSGGKLRAAIQNDLLRSPMEWEHTLDMHVCKSFGGNSQFAREEVCLLRQMADISDNHVIAV